MGWADWWQSTGAGGATTTTPRRRPTTAGASLPATSSAGYVEQGGKTYAVPTAAQQASIAAAKARGDARRAAASAPAPAAPAAPPPAVPAAPPPRTVAGPRRRAIATAPTPGTANAVADTMRSVLGPTVSAAPVNPYQGAAEARQRENGPVDPETGERDLGYLNPVAASPATAATMPVAKAEEAAPVAVPTASVPKWDTTGDPGRWQESDRLKFEALKATLPAGVVRDDLQYLVDPNKYIGPDGKPIADAANLMTYDALNRRAEMVRAGEDPDAASRAKFIRDQTRHVGTPRNVLQYDRYGNIIRQSIEAQAEEDKRASEEGGAAAVRALADYNVRATLPEAEQLKALRERYDVSGTRAYELKKEEMGLEDKAKERQLKRDLFTSGNLFTAGENALDRFSKEKIERWKLTTSASLDWAKLRQDKNISDDRIAADLTQAREAVAAQERMFNKGLFEKNNFNPETYMAGKNKAITDRVEALRKAKAFATPEEAAAEEKLAAASYDESFEQMAPAYGMRIYTDKSGKKSAVGVNPDTKQIYEIPLYR